MSDAHEYRLPIYFSTSLIEDNDMLGFLLRYSQMNETIENLLSKPSELLIDKDITKLNNDFDKQKKQIEYTPEDLYDIVQNDVFEKSKESFSRNCIST